ncbi:SRPBCC family protein [Rhodococcus sp. IEGM 248]|uniref:SRPBCC family protein n=1 Tax=Rhodococcus opacus TaxID=37919 RepID=UPI0013C252A1|nr:SRPBCC family protein [Rhodococcus opacus]MDV7087188.1 SRPBCC family protein [Rhodococcus opacus]NDV08198.1 SRPBCC family protein [Rhodococcus sp. IEGM 248]
MTESDARRDYRPGPLRHVEARPDGTRWALTFVREFTHSPSTLWTALTDPGELPLWAPYTADRNLGTVGPATLIMVDGQNRTELDGTVTRADSPHVLEHAWGDDVLLWTIDETDAGTRLTLRHTLDDQHTAAMTAAGWHMCLDVADALLDGNPIGPIVGAEAMNYGWRELNEQYSTRLGVEPIDPTLQ